MQIGWGFSNKQKQALMSCSDLSLGCVMSFRCIHFPLMSFQMHSTCSLRSLDYMYISEFYISSVGGWGASPLRSALWVFLSNGVLSFEREAVRFCHCFMFDENSHGRIFF